jgi:hypothetical protein
MQRGALKIRIFSYARRLGADSPNVATLPYPSFGSLANAMRGNTSNNAWKALDQKRPTDAQWQPAYLLRN